MSFEIVLYNISQYYSFYCIFYQINIALVNICVMEGSEEAFGSICRALLKGVVMKQAFVDTQQTDID